MNLSEVNVQASAQQLYAILGELLVENRLLKAIIAEHPEIMTVHAVPEPATNGIAVEAPLEV